MKSIADELARKAALIEARATIRNLSTPTQTMRKLTGSADRIKEKFLASKARNQAVADQLAAEEIEKMKQSKIAAATKPAASVKPAWKPTSPPSATKEPARELTLSQKASASFKSLADKSKACKPNPSR